MGNKQIKIAVVGDVHELWEADDEIALQYLGVDLVLFVGDLGNEWVAGVSSIASLALPKAVILGNHDAWYTATDWGRKDCPYDRRYENWFKDQLDILGKFHVGYNYLDFPSLNISVVGGRPFSWGGPEWKYPDFYRELYGVQNFVQSAALIANAANQTKCDHLIFIGHNGPKGLGTAPDAPCGKDWKPLGEDFGDSDLQEAIDLSRASGRNVPLVCFGHMHHRLRHKKNALRRMIGIDSGTVYVNAAWVPRLLESPKGGKLRNFSLVCLDNGVVSQVSLVWLGPDFQIFTEEILYSQVVKSVVLL